MLNKNIGKKMLINTIGGNQIRCELTDQKNNKIYFKIIPEMNEEIKNPNGSIKEDKIDYIIYLDK